MSRSDVVDGMLSDDTMKAGWYTERRASGKDRRRRVYVTIFFKWSRLETNEINKPLFVSNECLCRGQKGGEQDRHNSPFTASEMRVVLWCMCFVF